MTLRWGAHGGGIGLAMVIALVAAYTIALERERFRSLQAELETCRASLEQREAALDRPGTGSSAPQDVHRPQTLTRLSDSGEYSITLRARAAERRPTVSMPNITLVTHVTADRAERLAALCRTWRGPMSVAVFEKPGEPQGWAVDAVAMSDECLRRHADLHQVRAVRQSSTHGADMFANYPFNVQRNAALDGAVGEWVFLLDVDFRLVPSEAGRERIFSRVFHKQRAANPAAVADTYQGDRTLFVVPAVETVTKDVPPPSSIAQLREALARHEVCAFYGHYCKHCHLPTQVERYAAALHDDVPAPYRVEYKEGYEPYVVANRRHLPRYDERFIGRGWDKMSFFYEIAAQDDDDDRAFVVLSHPSPFLVHSGRGDLPSNYTAEYMDRQRENSMQMYNFKLEVTVKYPDSALSRKMRQEHAMDQQQRKQLIDWATISSSRGEGTACVSRWRKDKISNDSVAKLEAALSYACSHIDCTPLLPGGLRHFPTDIVAHADWAFDRYMGYAVARGETPEQACNFDGAARIATCAKACFGCIVRPTASTAAIQRAVEWVCGPDGLEDCKGIIRVIGGNATRGLEAKAAVLFTFHYMVHRCLHHDTNAACSFGGTGMRVPCIRVPD